MRKRPFLIPALIVAAVLLGCTAALSADPSVKRIDIDDLHTRLGQSGLTVIDVRSPFAWFVGMDKIRGAVRLVPLKLDWIDRLPPDETYVLYCS